MEVKQENNTTPNVEPEHSKWFYFWMIILMIIGIGLIAFILWAVMSSLGVKETLSLGLVIGGGAAILIFFIYVFVICPARDLAGEAKRDKLMDKYTDEDEMIKRKKERL